jgi:uncharacterized membrane protein YidH (DUF202 family)
MAELNIARCAAVAKDMHAREPEGGHVKILGILLMAFGVFVLVAGGIRYKNNETVVNVGPIRAQVEERKTLPLSPVLGVASIAAGAALVLVDVRRRPRARA